MAEFRGVVGMRGLRGREFAAAGFAFDEEGSSAIGEDGEVCFAFSAMGPFGHAAVQRNPTSATTLFKYLVVQGTLIFSIRQSSHRAAEQMRVYLPHAFANAIQFH